MAVEIPPSCCRQPSKHEAPHAHESGCSHPEPEGHPRPAPHVAAARAYRAFEELPARHRGVQRPQPGHQQGHGRDSRDGCGARRRPAWVDGGGEVLPHGGGHVLAPVPRAPQVASVQ